MSKKYCIRFWNRKRNELASVVEFHADSFSNRRFKCVVSELFVLACEGCENSALSATVYACGIDDLKDLPVTDPGVMQINCDSWESGSTIKALVSVNGTAYRNLVIAE